MTAIAIKTPSMNYPEIIEVNTEFGQTEKSLMDQYLKKNPATVIYRVEETRLQLILHRLRVQAGTEVTEVRTVGATFEDDV